MCALWPVFYTSTHFPSHLGTTYSNSCFSSVAAGLKTVRALRPHLEISSKSLKPYSFARDAPLPGHSPARFLVSILLGPRRIPILHASCIDPLSGHWGPIRGPLRVGRASGVQSTIEGRTTRSGLALTSGPWRRFFFSFFEMSHGSAACRLLFGTSPKTWTCIR